MQLYLPRVFADQVIIADCVNMGLCGKFGRLGGRLTPALYSLVRPQLDQQPVEVPMIKIGLDTGNFHYVLLPGICVYFLFSSRDRSSSALLSLRVPLAMPMGMVLSPSSL